MLKMNKNNSGFTLIELIIVIAIIGILATAIISGTDFIDQRAQTVDVGNYNIARNLQSAFEQYLIVNGTDDLTYVDNYTGDGIKNGDANFNKLVAKGVIKSSYQVPTGIFYLIKSGNFPEIHFKLTSQRYKKSICTAASNSDCWFKVPSTGALK
jgi:prepilin-type N-terminal cleavage/methylation domain-containing protein